MAVFKTSEVSYDDSTHPITGVREQPAPCASTATRKTSSQATRAARISSALTSHRRLEPSISVNKNSQSPTGEPRTGDYAPTEQRSPWSRSDRRYRALTALGFAGSRARICVFRFAVMCGPRARSETLPARWGEGSEPASLSVVRRCSVSAGLRVTGERSMVDA